MDRKMDDGRREAFDRLWRQEYARVVRSAFLMTGDREEAVDLAQEAFALAWRKWDRVADLEHAGAWLQRVLGNLSLNWRRRQRVRRKWRATPDASASGPELADPELTAALRELPPAQRTVAVLRYYADQSVEEVARALGKRPGTVRALSSQALERLRRSLSGSEVETHAR